MKKNTEVFNTKFSVVKSLPEGLSLCKCYVMHTGKCNNMFFFAREDIENNESSIYGKPVVGHVYEDEDGNFHMGSHDKAWDETTGKYKMLTVPFGFVTSTPTTFEKVKEASGITREYQVNEVILWTDRYPEVLETKYSDEIWFNQSMEIDIRAMTPYSGDKRYDHVTEYVYDALCLLGKSDDPKFNNEPCFPSASVVPFSLQGSSPEAVEFSKQFDELLEKAKTVFASINKENTEEREKNIMPNTTEPSGEFAISQNQKRRKLQECLKQAHPKGYICVFSIFDDYCYFTEEIFTEDKWIDKTYKQTYTVGEDNSVTLSGDAVEVFTKFLTAEELATIDSQRGTTEEFNKKIQEYETKLAAANETNADLTKQVTELTQFKLDVAEKALNAEKEAVFEVWKEKLPEETLADIKAKKANFSKEDLEIQCKVAFADLISGSEDKGNKKEFSSNGVRIPIVSNQAVDNSRTPYNGVCEYYKNKIHTGE